MSEGRSWQDEAACRGRTDLSWFPTAHAGRGGQSSEYRLAVAAAIEVCRTCPVMTECRAAGKDEVGIWGGELRREARKVRQVQPCGTPAAYARHRRLGEMPCRSCRTAFLVSRQERRDAASAAAATRVRIALGRTG